MSIRSLLVTLAVLAAALPATADACGMPYRGGEELLVQLKTIQPKGLADNSVQRAAPQQEDDPFGLELSPERAALAQLVAARVAEVTPARPKS